MRYRYQTREDLIRDWVSAPEPLADDAVVAAFDPVRALAAAEEARREEESLPWTRRTHVGFQEFAVRPGMGVAEALFWLRVAANLEKEGGPGYEWRFRADEALALYPEQMPSRDELEAKVVAAMQHGGEAAALWLLPLIGLRQVAEWFVSGRLDELAKRGGNWNIFFLDRGENRLPRLVRRSEWRAALVALDEHLDVDEWFSVCEGYPEKKNRVVKRPWTMAVALGHTEALRRLVESWPDEVWQSAEWPVDSGIRLVCGVRDPAFSLRHFARLRLRPECAAEAGLWLTHTGDAMLGPVLALVRRADNQDEAREIVGALGAVERDLASLALIELAGEKGAAQAAASAWVAEHGARLRGACARLWRQGGTHAGEAEAYLREAWRGANREAVEAVLLEADAQGAGASLLAAWKREENEEIKLEELVNAVPEAPARPRSRALPAWVRPERLAPLRSGARRAGAALVARLLELLRDGLEGDALVKRARAEFSEESREAFWRSLLAEWELAGTGKRDVWCLRAAVALRGAATAANLARLIMRWPTESQHQKAAQGLECLRAMGDALALQALVGVAERTRLAGLRARAEACVAEIAAELGITVDELADTSVPACGLDASSRREFFLGSRRCVATVKADGRVLLRSDDGRVLKNPPKPAVADDAERAAGGLKEWKEFKKALADTVKFQRLRLEHALAGGRRWSGLNFGRYVAAHPVLRPLASGLVWAQFDAEGVARLSFTLRAEDGVAVDAEGAELVPLAGDAEVGLLHPADAQAGDWARWREWLRARGGEQAVEQLERETHTVAAAAADDLEVAEFAGRSISGQTLRRRMDGLAWRRGVPQDAGLFYEYSKPFPEAGVTAVVETSGQSVVTGFDFENVEVRRVIFVPGNYEPAEYAKHDGLMRLGHVGSMAYSETVRALRLALLPGKAD